MVVRVDGGEFQIYHMGHARHACADFPSECFAGEEFESHGICKLIYKIW
jgi:hypothetical protein